jgi:fimbrial chaperone protein
VRVGGLGAPGAAEKTYRIFVEELPPVGATVPGAAVRVITKMGVPIFVRPTAARMSATLGDVSMAAGTVRFAITNDGSVHVVPARILVRGTDASGAQVFERDVPGWYILAGGRREFDVSIPPAACGRVASVAVEMQAGAEPVTRTVPVPAGACAP